MSSSHLSALRRAVLQRAIAVTRRAPAASEWTHEAPGKVTKRRPTTRTGILGLAVITLLICGFAAAGIPGLLIVLALGSLSTALYAIVSGRPSWAHLPSRKHAAVVSGAALVLIVIAGAMGAPASGPSSETAALSAVTHQRPTASSSPHETTKTAASTAVTAEEPMDPGSATVATQAACVVISDSSATDSSALSLLATLPIKGRAPLTGYARTADFGTAWLDVDRNGCDTRNDMLARDLTSITRSGKCRVMSGRLLNPCLGNSISFVRGVTTSALVQIDHVVALGDAWQTGAQQLSHAQRVSLANDPLNLLAVDGRSNEQKGAGDAATWLPANKSFRCAYVTRQVSVKVTYGLWVTQAEHDAMVRILDTCPTSQGMTSPFAPAHAVVVPVPEPVAAAPVAPAPVAKAPAKVRVKAAPVPANAPAHIPARPSASAPAYPGALCADSLRGQSGVAANGRTYVCGAKGPDARGRLHWNA